MVPAGGVGLRVGIQGIRRWYGSGLWNHFQGEDVAVSGGRIARELGAQQFVLHHLFKGAKGAIVRVVVLNLDGGDRLEILQSCRFVSGLLGGFKSNHGGPDQDSDDRDYDHQFDQSEAEFVAGVAVSLSHV